MMKLFVWIWLRCVRPLSRCMRRDGGALHRLLISIGIIFDKHALDCAFGTLRHTNRCDTYGISSDVMRFFLLCCPDVCLSFSISLPLRMSGVPT